MVIGKQVEGVAAERMCFAMLSEKRVFISGVTRGGAVQNSGILRGFG